MLHLAGGMRRAGWNVTVCCYDKLGDLLSLAKELDLRVELLPRKQGVDAGYFFRLARKLHHWNATVLHMHNSTALFYGVPAARLAGVPVRVYTEHDGVFPRGRMVAWCNRRLAGMLTQSVAVSRAVKQLWCDHDGINPARVMVIPNGVEDHYASSRPASRAASAELRIGYLGRLSREKGPDILLEAFAAAHRQISAIRLVVIGDGPERGNLERQASQLAAPVEFLGYRTDVPAILPTLDLLAMPSRTEGLPLALLEAMAASLPAAATNVGGNGEAMVDGVTGILVPPENPDALAEAMIMLASDAQLRSTMGTAARKRFLEHYELGKMVEAYTRLYMNER